MSLKTLLAPWGKTLRRLNVENEGDVRWLRFTSDAHARPVAGFTLEGVELLLWLDHVSPDDFRAAVADLWPEHGQSEEARIAATRQRLGLCMSMDIYIRLASHGSSVPLLEKFTVSSEYLAARAEAERMLRDRESFEGGPLQRPEILIAIDCGSDRIMARTLPLLAGMMKTQAFALRLDLADEYRFNLRVTKIKFGLKQVPLAAHKLVASLNALVACGVEITGVLLPFFDAIAKSTARESFIDLQTFLQTHPTDTPDECAGIQELRIGREKANPPVLPCLFSAIASSRSLREISITSISTMEINSIQSIALALFSSLASHKIERVAFEIGQQRQVQQMLNALMPDTDPLACVYSDQAAAIHTHRHLRAAASRYALYDPAVTKSQDNVVVDTYTHTELRVIDHVNRWWCVLLPAWNQAWVRDTDIVITTSRQDVVPRVGYPTVRKIEMLCYSARVDQVEALVSRMNPSVDELTLTAKEDTPSIGAWASVLSSFPCVRRLTLGDLRPRHLAPLVNAIGLRAARQPLQHLALCIMCERDESKHLLRFAGVICNPRSPVSRCLESLAIDARVFSQARELPLLMRGCERMLTRNKRLLSFRLDVDMRAANAASFGLLKVAILKHNGAFASVSAGALGRRHKLAFLSTLRTTQAHRAREQLDSGVVSIIFEFAARCCRRDVDVRFMCRQPLTW